MAANDSDGPHVGDGTPDAALFIGEEAFRAGWNALLAYLTAQNHPGIHTIPMSVLHQGECEAWARYEPSEAAKAMS